MTTLASLTLGPSSLAGPSAALGELATIEKLAAALADLPLGVHAVVGGALIAGLVLWSSGRSVLKPVMVFVAAVGGGLAGFLALPNLLPNAGVTPWFGAVGGAVIGLLAGLLLYRLVLMLAFGVSMSVAFGLIAAAGISLATGGGGTVAVALVISPPTLLVVQPTESPAAQTSAAALAAAQPPAAAPSTTAALEAQWADGPAGEQDGPDQPSSVVPASDPTDGLPNLHQLTANPLDAAARAREFVEAVRARAETSWRALSAMQQLIIGASGLVGLILGGLVGLTLPQWAAGALTAFVGAAVWLPAATWMLHAFQLPVGAALELPAAGWLVVWGVVSVMGVAVQWAGLMRAKGNKRKKEKRSRADD